MKKKEYKIKIENGEIKPTEPLDLTNLKEGIIIFFDDEDILVKDNESKINKIKAFESITGLLSDLSDKDFVSFEEALDRRYFFQDKE